MHELTWNRSKECTLLDVERSLLTKLGAMLCSLQSCIRACFMGSKLPHDYQVHCDRLRKYERSYAIIGNQNMPIAHCILNPKGPNQNSTPDF